MRDACHTGAGRPSGGSGRQTPLVDPLATLVSAWKSARAPSAKEKKGTGALEISSSLPILWSPRLLRDRFPGSVFSWSIIGFAILCLGLTGCPPVITNITPDSGPKGTEVTIQGNNFGEAQGTSTVTFNGVLAGPAISWSNVAIEIAVPSGPDDKVSGDVLVRVGNSVSKPFRFVDSEDPEWIPGYPYCNSIPEGHNNRFENRVNWVFLGYEFLNHDKMRQVIRDAVAYDEGSSYWSLMNVEPFRSAEMTSTCGTWTKWATTRIWPVSST